MYCSKCGKFNRDDADFCRYCGNKLDHDKIIATDVIEPEIKNENQVSNQAIYQQNIAKNNNKINLTSVANYFGLASGIICVLFVFLLRISVYINVFLIYTLYMFILGACLSLVFIDRIIRDRKKHILTNSDINQTNNNKIGFTSIVNFFGLATGIAGVIMSLLIQLRIEEPHFLIYLYMLILSVCLILAFINIIIEDRKNRIHTKSETPILKYFGLATGILGVIVFSLYILLNIFYLYLYILVLGIYLILVFIDAIIKDRKKAKVTKNAIPQNDIAPSTQASPTYNTTVNTNNKPKAKKSSKNKIIIASVSGGLILLTIITYFIIISGSRTIYFTKKQMMDDVKGVYTYNAGEGDYYFNYYDIVVSDDEIVESHSSYYSWVDKDMNDLDDYSYTTKIKRYSFLTGKIYYGELGYYLTVDEDGNLLNSKDNKVYIKR